MWKVGSLFSGIGGIELGLERAGGFRPVWFVEFNPYCQQVLKKHYPESKVYDDVTRIDWNNVERPDILTGGFPCQDISNAGQLKGIIIGPRSSLWKNYAEAICTLRPRVALIENVAALAYRGLNVVLTDLAQIGYDAEWFTLSASDVGAPHLRQRLFILAYPNRNGTLEQRRSDTDKERDASSKIQERGDQQFRPDCASPNETLLPNTNSAGLEIPLSEQQTTGITGTNFILHSDGKAVADGFPEEGRLTKFREKFGSQQWETEPRLGRLVDGFPYGMAKYQYAELIELVGEAKAKRISSRYWKEKIKALGNAVVPQCAQIIATRIKEVLQ